MNEKTKEALIHQLMGLRHTVDAVLSLLMGVLEASDAKCSHPHVMDLTTMGGPVKYQCTVCGEEWAPEPPESDKTSGRVDA